MCQFQNCAGECAWSFLGKVVARVRHLMVDAWPGEMMCRWAAISCREVTICQAIQGDSRNYDCWLRCKLLLALFVRRIAGRESEAMAVGVKHHVDVVRIVEGRSGSFQSGIVELPFRQLSCPDHPCDFASVRCETSSTTLSQEIVEVPQASFEIGPIGSIALLMSWMR